ncbi:MAG: prolipoprotein diacylglyceryl transferase family protein [Solirubrobacterales bacterium]
MYPEIDLGPITLQTFGLMFAAAFVVSGWLVALRLRELDSPADWAYEIILAAAVGGVLGAKLWYAFEEGDWSFDQLLSGSGLTWYGGALGGAAAVCAYAKWRGILSLTFIDVAAPALAAGYAVGRIGCQLSGDGDYGTVTDAWWGMSYADGVVPTPPGVEVHPTPIFETISMALLAMALWKLRNRFAPGVLFAIYLIVSGIERFLIEFLRRNENVALGMTLAQLTSVAMVLIGGAMLLAYKDRPREPRTLPPEPV